MRALLALALFALAGGASAQGIVSIKDVNTPANTLKVNSDGSINISGGGGGGGSVTQGTVPWVGAGSGTAGTPATGVMTVQGIAGATAIKVDGSAVTQPVSGSVGQGTPNTTSNAWPTVPTDGSGNVAGVAAKPFRVDPTGTTTQPVSQSTPGSFGWPVYQQPQSTSGAGLTITSATAASSLVAKASAGGWYDLSVSVASTPVYLMAFNATSAPADGAVTPAWCGGPFAANSTVSMTWGSIPTYLSTGITFVASSTGCTTKTATAVTAINARVQ